METPDTPPGSPEAVDRFDADPAARAADDARERARAALAEILEQFPGLEFSAVPPEHALLLRPLISDYVDALRVAGATPEHVVRRVKEIVTAAVGSGGVPASPLMEAVVAWTIEGYYRH